jgi:hypothetical protein
MKFEVQVLGKHGGNNDQVLRKHRGKKMKEQRVEFER